jgi:hypothetical protein
MQGNCDTKPDSLKLKEGIKEYHGRPFSTPKVHKKILKVKGEAGRLCDWGGMKWQTESE